MSVRACGRPAPTRGETLNKRILSFYIALCLAIAATRTLAEETVPAVDTARGDRMIAEYFRVETQRLTERCLADITTREDWELKRGEYRRELFEMLSLDPLPDRTPLNAVVTKVIDHEQFRVENVQFQSRPGLYVTGNLYLPKSIDGKAPAILYLCGHGGVKQDGVSYGNKVHYQHHGEWFARNGYVCLTIDTLQLGEIEGLHHGTYREGLWWWNARGYTPAGVEAWNAIRALDYLETRPEVDAERIGATGRSGGGAYTWWVAALDDRVKAAVPVAGITSLKNHVVDGCVEGHCDCMYPVNMYEWDYPLVAALVAPRPLLISNTDKDQIFPLDGVVDVYNKARRIYELCGAVDHVGLNIAEGPHEDTQELQINAFHWFNRFLKGQDPQIETAATPYFEPRQLKVFEAIPSDQQNTQVQETFTAQAGVPAAPASRLEWESQRSAWMKSLAEKCFRGWPDDTSAPLELAKGFEAEHAGIRFSAYDFTSQDAIRLRLYVAQRANEGKKPELVVLNVLDDENWKEFLATMQVGFKELLAGEVLPEASGEKFAETEGMFKSFHWAMAYIAPRGIGPTEWARDERERTHLRRRFMLLGQTEDGMRVWDVRRAVRAVRALETLRGVPLWMQGERQMAAVAMYASLFEPDVARLDLWHLPPTHRDGPVFLNVMRYFDTPQAVAMAAERSQVRIYDAGESSWEYAVEASRVLNWGEKRIQIRTPPAADNAAE